MKNKIELIRAIRKVGLYNLLKVKKIKKIAGNIIGGFFLTRVISTLLNIDFFAGFSGNSSINTHLFCKENNLDEKVLCALCDYLSSLGILKKNKSEYYLTAKGKFILEMGSGLFNIVYSFEDIFHNLEPILKKERTAERDINKFLYFEAKGTGEAAKLLVFPIIIDIIEKKKFKRIFDIGCGSAAFLIELCKNVSGTIGYGVDLSRKAVLHGREELIKYNLENRIKLFEGNIIHDLDSFAEKISDAEIITASFVLHELFFENKEQIINFLVKFRRRFENKCLLVCENIEQSLDELRKDPGLYSEVQLAHRLVGEQQMTRKDWHTIFIKSGFKKIKERYLSFARISIFILH
jgi:SAM-dependent methyltransferase